MVATVERISMIPGLIGILVIVLVIVILKAPNTTIIRIPGGCHAVSVSIGRLILVG